MCFRRAKTLMWAMAIGLVAGIATTSGGGLAQSPRTSSGDEASGPAMENGADLEHFSPGHLFRVLGKDVVSATGENMGRIVDVGTRKIAVDWSALYFDLGDSKNVIALDLGRGQLKAAPEYEETDKSIAVVTLPRLGTSRE